MQLGFFLDFSFFHKALAMFSKDQIGKLLGDLDDLQLTTVNGRITEIVGMLIKAVVPQVKIGEVCLVKREGEPLRAEVVGFTKDEVLFSPLGEMTGIGPSSEVIPTIFRCISKSARSYWEGF